MIQKASTPNVIVRLGRADFRTWTCTGERDEIITEKTNLKKHLKKKTHLTKDVLFPHLPGHPEGVDPRKVSKIYFSFLSMFNGIGVIDIA